MEGYIQTGLGILVSLILFVIGYRQTIGAKKERSKNANSSIMRTMMRRMVLEDYAPTYKDISRITEGKAREFYVSSNDLLSEEQILNSLYTEIFDSDLISSLQRTEIEKKLNDVFNNIEKEPIKQTLLEFQQIKQDKDNKKEAVTSMVLSASVLGALTSTLYSFYDTRTFELDFLLSAFGVLVGSIAILTALITYRKSKEIDISAPIFSASLVSLEFETDIINILTKSGLEFVIEPKFDNLSPDFLVNINGKQVAIEVKSWNGSVPLHILKKTIDYLQKLVSIEGIDEVILVTRKKDEIPAIRINNSNISVLSINELATKLKAAA